MGWRLMWCPRMSLSLLESLLRSPPKPTDMVSSRCRGCFAAFAAAVFFLFLVSCESSMMV